MKGKLTKSSTGITLIALVITIIVLLILAGVSISMVVGQNGILSNAQNSVIADAKAKEEEGVKTSALAAISISSSKGNIALEKVYFEQELNKEFGEGNYLLEEQADKFIVTIVGTGNSYEVDKFGNVSGQVSPGGGTGENGGEGENVSDDGYEGIYPEADTQPTDPTIFTYEIISEADKTIAITGIKKEYNSVYYYEYKGNDGNFPVDKKTGLVIPYEIDGYVVKEIKTLTLAPNYSQPLNTMTIIQLPKGLEKIGEEAFRHCIALSNISIPNTVITISEKAFWGCNSLTNITIPNSVTTIAGDAFDYCTSLQTVKYAGTQEEWNAITTASNNTYLTNATLVLNYKMISHNDPFAFVYRIISEEEKTIAITGIKPEYVSLYYCSNDVRI